MKARLKMKSLAEPEHKRKETSEPSKPKPRYPHVRLAVPQIGDAISGRKVGDKVTFMFEGVIDGIKTADEYDNFPKGTEVVDFNLTKGCVVGEAKKSRTPRNYDEAISSSLSDSEDSKGTSSARNKMRTIK